MLGVLGKPRRVEPVIRHEALAGMSDVELAEYLAELDAHVRLVREHRLAVAREVERRAAARGRPMIERFANRLGATPAQDGLLSTLDGAIDDDDTTIELVDAAPAVLAVVESATGRLVSFGTVVARDLPKGMEVVDVEAPAEGELWDSERRAFVMRPPKVMVDRLDDLRGVPEFEAVYRQLSGGGREKVDEALIKALGDRRFRGESDARERV